MATTSGLTDLEAEANPTLNELLENNSSAPAPAPTEARAVDPDASKPDGVND